MDDYRTYQIFAFHTHPSYSDAVIELTIIISIIYITVTMTTVTITPTGDNNVVHIVKETHRHLHVLQTLVVLLLGYSGIIIIIYMTVPVTTVTITPAGDNNVVDIIEGEKQTCTTGSSPPAAWIQWYNYYYLYYSTSDNSVNHSSW